MNYLLDTHILIWAISNPNKLSSPVQKILKEKDNYIFVSAVSLWEISIKYSLGNLLIGNKTPIDFLFECKLLNFEIINLTPRETATFYELKSTHHKDPFDRILIWQALKNDFIFVSDDKNVKKYISEGLKVIA
jgi:PIN domain nuclease of toxin-antitoxin system